MSLLGGCEILLERRNSGGGNTLLGEIGMGMTHHLVFHHIQLVGCLLIVIGCNQHDGERFYCQTA